MSHWNSEGPARPRDRAAAPTRAPRRPSFLHCRDGPRLPHTATAVTPPARRAAQSSPLGRPFPVGPRLRRPLPSRLVAPSARLPPRSPCRRADRAGAHSRPHGRAAAATTLDSGPAAEIGRRQALHGGAALDGTTTKALEHLRDAPTNQGPGSPHNSRRTPRPRDPRLILLGRLVTSRGSPPRGGSSDEASTSTRTSSTPPRRADADPEFLLNVGRATPEAPRDGDNLRGHLPRGVTRAVHLRTLLQQTRTSRSAVMRPRR